MPDAPRTYRTGRSVGITLYRDDRCIGSCINETQGESEQVVRQWAEDERHNTTLACHVLDVLNVLDKSRRTADLLGGALVEASKSFTGLADAVLTSVAEGGSTADVIEVVATWLDGGDALDDANIALYERAKAATPKPSCPHVSSTDEGTSHCTLAERPAGWLADAIRELIDANDAVEEGTVSFDLRNEQVTRLEAAWATVRNVLGRGDMRSTRPATQQSDAQRRAVVAESIYQRYADGYHPVWHERIEPPTWNSHVPGRDDTEPMTPDQVAWLRGEPLPVCSTCRDSGLVAQSPGQPGDGPAPCPDCAEATP